MTSWLDEDTWQDPSLPRRQPKSQPNRREEEEAAFLCNELMDIPAGERLTRLKAARFQTPALFDLLLERGHTTLIQDPGTAGELLEAAVELGYLLNQKGECSRDLEGEGVGRALCLMATADRLRGNFQSAETILSRAGHYAFSSQGRGFFARSFGLLRWDQGRAEEAICFLQHALRRFSEDNNRREQGACNALLGLLALEEENRSASLHLRQALRASRGGEMEPSLAAQAALGWALCLSQGGQSRKALSAREEAWRFYREIGSEEALVSVYWLEGKLALSLGLLDDGHNLLDSVRTSLIQAGWVVEATLATVDLGLAWFQQGRAGELMRLYEELGIFQDSPGYEQARQTFGVFVDDAANNRLDIPVWEIAAPSLRMAFRLQGVRTRPVLCA